MAYVTWHAVQVCHVTTRALMQGIAEPNIAVSRAASEHSWHSMLVRPRALSPQRKDLSL